MRFFVLVIGLSIASGPLMAGCNKSLLLFDSWTSEPINSDKVRLTSNFTYKGDRPIRMLDAKAEFRDILGEFIADFALERDISLIKGATHQVVKTWDLDFGLWVDFNVERLLDLNPTDINQWVCVEGVVYQDGNVEKF